MNSPQISIITATRNGERFLKRTLESVPAASPQRIWEHVIVDDGSRDATPRIVAACADADPRVRGIVQPNAGVAAARNRGLAESDPRSRYLLILDHDDLLCPDSLERLADYLDRHADASAVFGSAGRIDATDAVLSEELELCLYRLRDIGGRTRLVRSQERRLGFRDLIGINPIPTPGLCLIRRDALERVGGFDPTAVPCDDWDLWLRLSLDRGAPSDTPVHRIPDRTLLWRAHDDSLSNQWALMRRQRRAVYERYLRRTDTAALTRAALPLGLYGLDAGYWKAATGDALRRGRPLHALLCVTRWLRRSGACRLLQVWQGLRPWQMADVTEVAA